MKHGTEATPDLRGKVKWCLLKPLYENHVFSFS
jgi:hypothetical protein